MKKLILGVVSVAFLFTGCATDGIYNVAKAGYKGGKVVAQNIPMSDEKRAKLKKIDKGATTYDKARTVVRNQLDDAGKKQVADTSKVTDK